MKPDIQRKRLLREADLLTALGDPRGLELKAIALKLPLASLERLHG